MSIVLHGTIGRPSTCEYGALKWLIDWIPRSLACSLVKKTATYKFLFSCRYPSHPLIITLWVVWNGYIQKKVEPPVESFAVTFQQCSQHKWSALRLRSSLFSGPLALYTGAKRWAWGRGQSVNANNVFAYARSARRHYNHCDTQLA